MRALSRWTRLAIGILCAGSFLTQVSFAATATKTSVSVFPLTSSPYGNSYGDWAAAWWQWAFSLPAVDNPLFDETGSKCGNGQSGPVFFLAGVFNVTGSAVRNDCTVPSGKALFFPILNVECSNVEGNGDTQVALRDCAAFYAGLATGLQAEIDGVSIPDLSSDRVVSPSFDFSLPNGNVLGAASGSCIQSPPGSCVAPNLSAGDGFYVMVAPLSDGAHTVHFKGTFGAPINFTTDVTYHMHVGG